MRTKKLISVKFNHDIDRQIEHLRGSGLRCIDIDSDLVGKVVINRYEYTKLIVKSAKKVFHNGWWLELICMGTDGVRKGIPWKNLSCADKDILALIEENNYMYEIA